MVETSSIGESYVINELQSLSERDVNVLMLKDVFPNWTETHRVFLGFRSEAHNPTRCPLKLKMCDDCRWFAGCETKGAAGVLGECLPACCGLLLLASPPQTEGVSGE
jgi:hypothetical protein